MGEEVDTRLVKERSLVGVMFLISRSFLIQVVSQISLLLLTIFLDPKTFGVFFLVSAFINFFVYFSDIGLAAALIQKKEKLEDEDLKTTFTIQQILAVALLVIIFFISPLAQKWYNLEPSAIFLFYSLGFSFFLASLKTIPSVLLERQLKFQILVIPQIIETLVFNLVSVSLAWKGFGLYAFTLAVLARGIVGLVAIYLLSPWKPSLAFSKDSLKRLLKFGVPYQANTVIAVIKDDLMTIFLGRIVGPIGLGYLGWAKKWAEQPLRFFMDNVAKVTFPAFSRLQDDKEKLKVSVEKSLFFLCFLTFPILVGFSILASDLVKIIPRYLKWQPALLTLYLYSFNSAWATVSTSMTNLLNAVGKIKTTFKLMMMWLVLTWAITPIAAIKFGYIGVAFSTSLISISSIVAIIAAKKLVNFDLKNSVGKPVVSSLLMGAVVFCFKFSFLGQIWAIVFRAVLGLMVYLVVSKLLLGEALLEDIKRFWYEIRKKN